MKIRNTSGVPVTGQVRRFGVVEDVQFHPGISVFADGTELLSSHPSIKVAGVPAKPKPSPEPAPSQSASSSRSRIFPSGSVAPSPSNKSDAPEQRVAPPPPSASDGLPQ